MTLTGGVVFMPSTPLHLMHVLALVTQFAGPQVQFRLLLIDQSPSMPAMWLTFVRSLAGRLFASVEVLYGAAPGQSSRQLRRANLALVAERMRDWQPDHVMTGSDRRIEFQYAMTVARQFKPVVGHYLDDGLGSYLPVQRQAVKDWLDCQLKRAYYGGWYRCVRWLGHSDWIGVRWLLRPDLLETAGDEIKVRRLLPQWYVSEAFLQVSADLFSDQALVAARQAEVMVLYPHPSVLRAHPELLARYDDQVARLLAQGRQVVVKRHPRDVKAPMPVGVAVLPSWIGVEYFLPFWQGRLVIGDMSSTALYLVRMLSPAVQVRALGCETEWHGRFLPLARTLGVEFLEYDAR